MPWVKDDKTNSFLHREDFHKIFICVKVTKDIKILTLIKN